MSKAKLGFVVELSHSYEDALAIIAEILKTEGFGILTKIDVRQTLKEKLGEDFRPYAILGACNPHLAYRALQADPEIGLMLPCSITVESTISGGTIIRIADPAIMMRSSKSGNPTLQAVSAEARTRLMRAAEILAQS